MKKYEELSKTFYLKMFTEYFAYELYLDNKYHKKHNNTINQILNTCFDPWPVTDEEKEVIISNGKVIAKSKYNISI